MVISFQSYILILGTNVLALGVVADFTRQTFSYFFELLHIKN